MIICIDDIYFNPLQITVLTQDKNDICVYMADNPDSFLRFKNWKIYDFAAHINQLIKEF